MTNLAKLAYVSTTQQIAELVSERVRVHAELPPPAERRRLRKAAGLSQSELARIVGVSTAAIGHYETGLRNTPKGERLDRYVAALRALREADVMVDADGWCSPEPGEDVEDFLDKFVASRAPLTEQEISALRAIFRPTGDPPKPLNSDSAA